MSDYIKFRRTGTRRAHGSNLSGFFFLLPPDQQAQRIRALARQFSDEQIASIVRLSCREVRQLIENVP